MRRDWFRPCDSPRVNLCPPVCLTRVNLGRCGPNTASVSASAGAGGGLDARMVRVRSTVSSGTSGRPAAARALVRIRRSCSEPPRVSSNTCRGTDGRVQTRRDRGRGQTDISTHAGYQDRAGRYRRRRRQTADRLVGCCCPLTSETGRQ